MARQQDNSIKYLITEEWELFIYAQDGLKKSFYSPVIIPYSENLKKRIETVINKNYPHLDCPSLDVFLDTYTYKSGIGYSLNDDVYGLDYRIKYAIFSYGYLETLLFSEFDNDELNHRARAEQATAFKLNEYDLNNLFGIMYPINICE